MEDEKKQLTNEECLILFQHDFVKKLLGNLLDLKRHEEIKKNDPGYMRDKCNFCGRPYPPGTGMSINQMIRAYKEGVKSAKGYLSIIRETIEIEKKGKIEDEMNDEYLDAPVVDIQLPDSLKNGDGNKK